VDTRTDGQPVSRPPSAEGRVRTYRSAKEEESPPKRTDRTDEWNIVRGED
jgi:hypothetical protein